jgi:hypothetical protein
MTAGPPRKDGKKKNGRSGGQRKTKESDQKLSVCVCVMIAFEERESVCASVREREEGREKREEREERGKKKGKKRGICLLSRERWRLHQMR